MISYLSLAAEEGGKGALSFFISEEEK